MGRPTVSRRGLAACALIFMTAPLSAEEQPLSAEQLAGRINHHLEADWKRHDIRPAAPASDPEILRRLYLDLAGRIPNILELADFRDDDRPEKRALLIDRLLEGVEGERERNGYASHFARVWEEWLLPANAPPLYGASDGFETWLREGLRKNHPYDRMVRELLTASGAAARFRASYENDPANLASATARLFMGIKLECAQCHDDRSGGDWSREQFWQLAAFFKPSDDPKSKPLEITIPGGREQVVRAAFLDKAPLPEKVEDPKALLADWLVRKENPYFARALVNRLWAYFLGMGLIDPVEEFSAINPPSHPALLDELAGQFRLHDYDLKYLIRAIVLSRPYQLSSKLSHVSQESPRHFARMRIRSLSAAQLYDSLSEATEHKTDEGYTVEPFRQGETLTPRQKFLRHYSQRTSSSDTETSILQALHLMNGPLIEQITDVENSPVIKTIHEAAGITTADRVTDLFRATLTRAPTEKELDWLVKYIDKGGPTGNRRNALADVFWALLNSPEFALNH